LRLGVHGHTEHTRIAALKEFYPAENYHQEPYVVFNDLPKIEPLKRVYPQLYRPTPVALNAVR